MSVPPRSDAAPQVLTPWLGLPEDDATIDTTTPTFEWRSAIGADSYGLQVLRFGGVVYDSEVLYGPIPSRLGTSTFTLPPGYLQHGNTYQWRVRAHDVGTTSLWTILPWTFSVASQPPATPVLILPANGAVTSVMPALLWWGTNASFYDVRVYRPPYNITEDLVFSALPASNGVTITAGSLQHGVTYLWLVRAYGTGYGWGAFSTTGSFTVEGVREVDVQPTAGSVGDSVTVSGAGFRAETTVFVDFGTVFVDIGTTDGTGSFTTQFSVPPQPKGTVTVTVEDSWDSAMGTFEVRESVSFAVNGADAAISSGAFSAEVGDSVTVTGNGFQATASVDVSLGNGQQASTTTDPVGSVSHTFVVEDSSSHTPYQPSVDSFGTTGSHGVALLAVTPSISASSGSGRAGDEVQVVGRGFARDSQVDIFVGRDWSGADASAVEGMGIGVANNGSFAATVRVGDAAVPSVASQIKAGIAEAGFVVLPSEATLTLRAGGDEVGGGAVGTLLTVSSSQATFVRGETVEVFLANQSMAVLQAMSGTFITSFAVPVTPGGTKQVRAVGADTGETQTVAFTVVPSITSISESLFDLGETATITGNGAGASDSLQVMLATASDDSPFGDAVEATSAPVTITAGGVADASGIFQLSFRVDNRVFGSARKQVRLKVVSAGAGIESGWFGADHEIPGGLEILTNDSPALERRNAWVYDPAPGGNGNGEADAGESVRPRIRLSNVGNGDAENVRVSVSTTDPDIDITRGVVTHATWPVGTARNNDGLLLAISPTATAHDASLVIDVTADSGGPWQFT
ncbi:hypothetical protein HN937_26270, partial [Candidatus Poribacteria bacterium]|nr:hypothetical protein [Candidatus Poribacteria bacterium]